MVIETALPHGSKRLTIVNADRPVTRSQQVRVRRGRPRRTPRPAQVPPLARTSTTSAAPALRADLRATRVLPDADRGRDPPRPRRRDGGRLDAAARADRAGQRQRHEDAAADRGGHPDLRYAPLRADRRLGRRPRRIGAAPGPAGSRPSASRAMWPTTRPPSPAPCARIAGPKLVALPRLEPGQLHRRRRRSPARAGRTRHADPRIGSCSGPTWPRTGRVLEAAYDDAKA